MEFTKCPLSIEEIEQYRDEDGFIDLDRINLVIDESSRNQVGTVDIFKYWIDFAGTKVLLKEEKRLNGEENYTIYSELIMSELAKQVGVQAAKCDLIKFKGKRGIISYLAFEYGKEALEMTDAIIGPTKEYSSAPECFDFFEIEEKLIKALKEDFDLTDGEITEIINERRKQKILQLFSCEADNHIQNEGFIIWRDESGKPHIKVAPMFDNEHSFALQYATTDLAGDIARIKKEKEMSQLLELAYNTLAEGLENTTGMVQNIIKNLLKQISTFSQETIEEMLNASYTLRSRIMGQGKIISLGADKEFKQTLMVDKTLAHVLHTTSDEKIKIFYDRLITSLDIKKVIENVEMQIRAEIPETAKQIIAEFVRMRLFDFEQITHMDERTDSNRKACILHRAAQKFNPLSFLNGITGATRRKPHTEQDEVDF